MDYADRHPDKQYLSSYDLIGVGEVTTIITGARLSKIERSTDKDKLHTIIELYGLKPMVVNITNDKMIIRLTRKSKAEDWIGTIVTIGADPVRAFGEDTFGLRIRPVANNILGFYESATSIEDIKKRHVALKDRADAALAKKASKKWTT